MSENQNKPELPPLPTSIGGYQHLDENEIVRVGDLLVRDGKPFAWGTIYVGMCVGEIEAHYAGFRVYRLLPVTKQGDNDETGWKEYKAQSMLQSMLPTSADARKRIPIATGFIDYFPLAIAAIAEVSLAGNKQHMPGQPLHWDRSKSGDESDALMRHFLERGKMDSDGYRHSAKMAWRALALLEKELEGKKA